jgi:hypothetical protein
VVAPAGTESQRVRGQAKAEERRLMQRREEGAMRSHWLAPRANEGLRAISSVGRDSQTPADP